MERGFKAAPIHGDLGQSAREKALSDFKAGKSDVLVALQPIFAAIFVKLSGGHIPSTAWLGMIVSFIGVVLVSGVDLHFSYKSFLGDVAAIISAALAACYMMAGSKAQRTLETTTYTTVCYFVCTIKETIAGETRFKAELNIV